MPRSKKSPARQPRVTHEPPPATIESSPRRGSDASAKDEPASDVALIHGVTEDGRGLKVLRRRADRIELGAVHPIEDGKPLTGDVVRLKPRKDFPLLCDVETQFSTRELAPADDEARASSESARSAEREGPNRESGAQQSSRPGHSKEQRASERRHGPPMVASSAYRKNWDQIWKRSKSRKSSAMN